MGLVAGLQPEDPREIGPYRLLGKLGSGGMGHVFLGMSAGGRPIAVKVIREELADDPQFRTRFRGEVAAARKVSGLFTAYVVDADLDGAVPWLATSYVAGPSLTDAVRQHGPLPTQTLLALAAGLAEGLSAIHAAGVVHRDLKPSNVLLAEDGPRVIDFGISEAAEASALTGANVVIGSPGFLSPEQILGQNVGPPGDIFSLGAVLTFAGTGQGPFGSGPKEGLLYRLINDPPSLDQLPEEIRPLVASCLAKLPGDRPTALEALAEVGAIQPARGWLSESIIYGSAADELADQPDSPTENLFRFAGSFAGPPAAAGIAAAAGSAAGAGSAAAAGSAAGAGSAAAAGSAAGAGSAAAAGSARRHVRRRLSRPLASACITGGLVAACVAAVFGLTGAGPKALAPLAPQAQPQARAVQSTPTSVSHASVTPRALPSRTSSVPAPNAYLTPSLSEFLTTPPAGTVLPTKSPSPGESPSPSKAPSTSASASPSRSSSAPPPPSSSASPSPSKSTPPPSPSQSAPPAPTPTPTPSASPSPSPSNSGGASPSPSDSESSSLAASVSPSASAS
jgi:eukaryotic-like serine/threonine-protein kinase